MAGYGQSKTALNLFSLELDNRIKASGVRAYALHPGNIMGTGLAREASVEIFHQLGVSEQQGNLLPEFATSMRIIPQGAATTIWCATCPLLNNMGGVYCEDADIAQLASEQGISAGVKLYSLDEMGAKRLWTLSEEMAGITFNMD